MLGNNTLFENWSKKKEREREKNKAGKDLHSRSCDHEGQFV